MSREGQSLVNPYLEWTKSQLETALSSYEILINQAKQNVLGAIFDNNIDEEGMKSLSDEVERLEDERTLIEEALQQFN